MDGLNSERLAAIDQIRHFDRTYLPFMALMGQQRYLGHDLTLTDARVLLGIREEPDVSARMLCDTLNLDKGYVSRMLRRFEDDGLLARRPSPDDGRVALLSLTEKGESLATELEEDGRAHVARMVRGASDEMLAELAAHMSAIEQILASISQEGGVA